MSVEYLSNVCRMPVECPSRSTIGTTARRTNPRRAAINRSSEPPGEGGAVNLHAEGQDVIQYYYMHLYTRTIDMLGGMLDCTVMKIQLRPA